MAGVPMFALSEQRSGLADPVVQVLRRGEPSGMHEINETMALYTLPRETPRDTGGGVGDPSRGQSRTGEVQALTTTQVNLRLSLRRSARRMLAKRGVPAAIFIAVVGGVVWFAIPAPPHHRMVGESPRTAGPAPARPALAPEPVQAVGQPPAPSPLPATAAHDADDTPVVEVVSNLQPAPPTVVPQMASSKQNSARSAKTAPARASVSPTPDVRPSKPAASATHTGTDTVTRTQSTAPRAGALSPEDF